jgi:hypothetical protein
MVHEKTSQVIIKNYKCFKDIFPIKVLEASASDYNPRILLFPPENKEKDSLPKVAGKERFIELDVRMRRKDKTNTTFLVEKTWRIIFG